VKEKAFKTEADLCRRFLDGVAKIAGWTPYAETAGWDILLVRNEDGFQIGIEAKLKLNLQVINQAIDGDTYGWSRRGPDCRAILVPDTEYGFEALVAYIGLTIIKVAPVANYVYRNVFNPDLPTLKHRGWREEWHEWCPVERHPLPEYVPDVVAGASAPVQLTDWKIGALKIVAILESRGFVTREDFKHVGIDHRRWLKPASWLIVEDGRYVAGHMPDFKGQHPTVYAQIVADAPKWMPKTCPTLLTALT
jgi:hypothetical protein